MQPKLSSDEELILEHFWDPRRKEIRSKLPLGVIAFLDAEAKGTEYKPSPAPAVLPVLERLCGTKMLRKSSGGFATDFEYELGTEGRAFIERKHPRLFVLWDRLIERTPRIVTFAVAVLGFLATIFGIIDHFSKH